MTTISRIRETGAVDSIDDIFRAHQLAVLKWFMVTVSVLLLPFDINHLLQGRYPLGLALAVVIVLFVTMAASIHLRQRSLIPPVFIFIPVTVTLALAISEQGVSAVFWCYPCILLAYYTLSRMQANLVASVMAVVGTALAFVALSPEIAVRVGATLFVTIVFANIFLGMIDRLTSRMGDLAHVDALTGIYNRRYLDDCVRHPMAKNLRHGTPMSLLLVDVDHFKRINDQFGHGAGDTVLQAVAERMNKSIRAIDQLFRVGGEEFAVLLPEAGIQAAQRVAEKLRTAMASQPLAGQHAVTVSIGAAELQAGETFGSLFKRCDKALYQAKAEGRNRVCSSALAPLADA